MALDQTRPKMNKNENLWVVIHMMTWELAAEKEISVLCEIYSHANSTPETFTLEAIFMIGPFLAD